MSIQGEYYVAWCGSVVAIGCNQRTIDEWESLPEAELKRLSTDTKNAVAKRDLLISFIKDINKLCHSQK